MYQAEPFVSLFYRIYTTRIKIRHVSPRLNLPRVISESSEDASWQAKDLSVFGRASKEIRTVISRHVNCFFERLASPWIKINVLLQHIKLWFAPVLELRGCAGGRSSTTIFFFFAYPNYIFSPERGDATFILIDIQNNFYENLNLRKLEN
jgi:hypothetical protein